MNWRLCGGRSLNSFIGQGMAHIAKAIPHQSQEGHRLDLGAIARQSFRRPIVVWMRLGSLWRSLLQRSDWARLPGRDALAHLISVKSLDIPAATIASKGTAQPMVDPSTARRVSQPRHQDGGCAERFGHAGSYRRCSHSILKFAKPKYFATGEVFEQEYTDRSGVTCDSLGCCEAATQKKGSQTNASPCIKIVFRTLSISAWKTGSYGEPCAYQISYVQPHGCRGSGSQLLSMHRVGRDRKAATPLIYRA